MHPGDRARIRQPPNVPPVRMAGKAFFRLFPAFFRNVFPGVFSEVFSGFFPAISPAVTGRMQDDLCYNPTRQGP
ncbi:MAG: hypothetical protein OXN16_10285, partial [Gammaproteobacteria bacterium]|nr:hypothetical protein [Gammaproteobacteria bacterium]MDE0281449.1 hypothetical protein [Gammaproteobacteria bacterium]